MAEAPRDIRLEGLAAPIRTVDCADILADLKSYLPGWPFVVTPRGEDEPCATIVHNGRAYLVQSRHLKTSPKIHRTAVNAVCDVLSALAGAMLRQDPERLCLHAAGIEVPGGLVLLPATRRAGKSTLSTTLMAEGATLFTDDWLPVEEGADGLVGLATGIAPRLRLPLPETVPESLLRHLDAHPGPDNGQYRYLPSPRVAPAGARAPIRAILILDRRDAGGPQLSPLDQDDLLARLIHQNFARGRDAGAALDALLRLAASAPAWRLSYSDPGPAAEMILAGLPEGERGPAPTVPARPQFVPVETGDLPPGVAWRRTAHAVLTPVGEAAYAAAADGSRILRFDAMAVAILDALGEGPLRSADLVAAMAPETAEAERRITTDVDRILDQFRSVGFIAPAEAGAGAGAA